MSTVRLATSSFVLRPNLDPDNRTEVLSVRQMPTHQVTTGAIMIVP